MDKKFLKELADHEKEKVEAELSDRERTIMYAGARLNWVGDYIGNPAMLWEEKDLELEELEFTGNNEFLINVCERSPKIFQEMITNDPKLKEKYTQDASFGDEAILVRTSDHDFVKYKILDGLHRVVGACLSGRKTIRAMVPQNEKNVKPVCEAHTVYDLIRGFIRNRHNEIGREELFFALKLLINTYSNVEDLLKNRFNEEWVKDKATQEIISKVLEEYERN